MKQEITVKEIEPGPDGFYQVGSPHISLRLYKGKEARHAAISFARELAEDLGIGICWPDGFNFPFVGNEA